MPSRPPFRAARARTPRLIAAALVTTLLAGALPFAAGTAAEAATSQNGITLSVNDGQTVAGAVSLTATDTQAGSAATIAVDGDALETTRTDPAVTLDFQSHGWESNTLNTFYVNGDAYEIRPLTRYWDWANGKWPVPASALHAGENTIELKIGSTKQVLDPGDNANDDFNVRSVHLTFADGSTAYDPSISPSNKTIPMGDGSATSLRTYTWKVTVPAAKIAPTMTATWNADAATPGDHVVTATSADGSRVAKATVKVDVIPGFVERVVLTPGEDASTSQSITWRTEDRTTAGQVHIRRVGDTDWRVVEARANEVLATGDPATRTHSATVTDLTPGTQYEYYVGSAAATSDTYRFTTARAAGDPFTFLYFGDAQNDLTAKWAPVVKQAYERFPDAIGTVNAGDLIDASRNDSEWSDWFGAMDGYSQTTNVIAAPGNHEYVGDEFLRKWKSNFEYPLDGPSAGTGTGTTEGEIQAAAYRQKMAEAIQETAYYSDYQGVRFIALNAGKDEAVQMATPANLPSCSTNCPDPAQLWVDMQSEWLEQVLSHNPNTWTVVVFHQPVFSTAVDRDEPELRAAWTPIFEKYGVDLVLMGHDHTYARGFLNTDATSTPGVTTGPVYAVSVSGPKYYEQQPANDNVWTRNGATQVASAGHTSTFQGITVDGDTLKYSSIVAAKWDDKSTTDVPVGGTLDAFTITKYDSGAKFVTEDGVAVPADPGGPQGPDLSGLSFSIPNGSKVSGITKIDASDAKSEEAVAISLDGRPQTVTPRDARVSIAFEAHGWEATTKNTLVINDGAQIVPLTRYYDWATGRFTIPSGALHPGANKIQLWAGSTTMMNDPTPSANDDFRVRNLRLEFADGTKATDPAMGTNVAANIGDDGTNVRSWTWNITVPEDKLVSGSTFTWDTTAQTPGAHVLTATSADGTRSSSITTYVDNYAPVTLDLQDGQRLNGAHSITATTDVAPTIAVDGTPLTVEERRRAVNPVFTFEGDGFQPDAVMDSIWVNGSLYRVLGVPEAAHGYKTVQVEIPWDLLKPGANTIRIRSGGNLSPTGNDVDNFTTRNSRLVFAGDRVLTDPAYTPSQVLSYNVNVKFRDFTFTIPAGYETVYQADWATPTAADGEHVVTVTRPDGRSSATATVVTDNSGPEVRIGAPVEGAAYVKSAFTVDATATDAHDVTTFALDIDGTPVENGATISADALPSGAHLFTARAVDPLGNVTSRTVAFTTAANAPFAPAAPTPADRATGQSPSDLLLGATVADPAGDALDVTFKRGYLGDAAGGQVTAKTGTTTAERPDVSAGDALAQDGYAALTAADGKVTTTVGDRSYPYQQFDVAVPDAARGDIDVTWAGSVPDAQRAVLSVWNHTKNAWQQVAEGTGANLTLTGPASVADTVRDGKATVMVQDVPATVIAQNGANAVWAWISDTQFYSERDESTYEKEVRWVLDNKDKEGIGYGVHTGDIVNQKDLKQWQVADKMQKIWDDAGFPYGILPGNHDVDYDGGYATYKQFFGEERYAGKPWYGGSHDDNVQHWDLVSTPEADYLVVYIDWLLDDADVAWANDVIRAHPDANVVIATHQYLNGSGGYTYPGPQIWDKIVKPNPNVKLVLSGHLDVDLAQKDAGNGRTVVEVMADYQSAPNNGDGWMRTMTFDAKAQTYSNRTFSATREGTYWKKPAVENFTVPLAIAAPTRWVSSDYVAVAAQTDQVVGAVAGVASGSSVQVPAGALQPNTRYSWFAEATDKDGYTTASPVWTFTTGDRALAASSVSATAAPVQPGEAGQVRVTVASDPQATGTVEVREGSTLLGTGTLEGGAAIVSLPVLAVGSHTLSVRYLGDSSVAAAQGEATLLVADTTAPVLTVPGQATLAVGDAFDPRAGVIATDSLDGDITARVAVSGTVDTTRVGQYTLTYTVADAAGNTASATRAVVVVAAQPDGVLSPEKKDLVVESVQDGRITVKVPTSAAGGSYTWVVYSTSAVLGTFATDAAGRVTLTLPAGLEPGAHRIAAFGPDGKVVTWGEFALAAGDPGAGTPSAQPTSGASAPTGGLPATGANGAALMWWAGGAGVLLLLGALLVTVTLRRRMRRS